MDAKNYTELSEYAAGIQEEWLNFSQKDYYTTVVMAHSVLHTGRLEESHDVHYSEPEAVLPLFFLF